MNEIPSTPSSADKQVTSLETIPSVVGSAPKKGIGLIVGFLGFMLVVGMLVCKKAPPPKEETPVVASTPIPLPPAIATAGSIVPYETILSRSNSSMAGGESLLDVRRKSPVVIFNKTAGNSGGSTVTGMINPVIGTASESTQNSGVPLPRGFSPSAVESAHATEIGDRDSLIAQGKLIDAVLETAINSDHPGMLRALVSHDIYGESGRSILLPRGSRLIGQYDAAVAKGQNRVFVLWQRAIRPDGIDIQLGSAGTDPLGGTGIEGDVNNHFWAMFGAATLLSVIGAAASTVGVSPLDQNNSIAQYRENLTSGLNTSANTILGQYTQIKPTITVRQGVEIKVFVARDLYFDSFTSNESGVQWIQ